MVYPVYTSEFREFMAPIDRYVKQPEPSTKIWRYMDFTKFASMLDKQALFFSQPKRFDDKYEVSYHLFSDPIDDPDDAAEFFKSDEHPRSYSAVNCWHMNEDESMAMWKLYLISNEGIAVQSTVERVETSVLCPPLQYALKGIVNYGLVPPLEEGESNPMDFLLFFKRKSFEHEREFRLVIRPKDQQSLNKLGGVFVSAQLDRLIEKVYVAPSTPHSFRELVSSLVVKYGLSADIVFQSDLDNEPLY